MPTTKLILFAMRKGEWDTRRALVSPLRIHFMCSGMAKGTSQAEATLNNKVHSLSHCQVMLVWRHQAFS